MLVFIQLISLQYASGKTGSALKNKKQKTAAGISAYHFKLSKKQNPSVKKILFEDLPFVHYSVKKPGLECYLFPETQSKPGTHQVPETKIQQFFTYSCYTFIFDQLYPKHVFW
ncbi:hypothetical protein [Pedobacter heparinus]|uniref:hypothetical protein n=1 Tax=Pedobacter heparinus TaxID=984 RepID=UPI0029309F6B|nr:hypothetical protein [Pedobacter heparinus]